MAQFVRITEIALTNFKNVKQGVVQMPAALRQDFFSQEADLLGIYGQNGSGKTAIVQALALVQTLLMGKALPAETAQYILKEADDCTICAQFALVVGDYCALVRYNVTLARDGRGGCYIAKETLDTKKQEGNLFLRSTTLIASAFAQSAPLFTPKKTCDAYFKANPEGLLSLAVAKKLAEKENASFLFHPETRAAFTAAPAQEGNAFTSVIEVLYYYANFQLFVLSNAASAPRGMNLLLPHTKSSSNAPYGALSRGELRLCPDAPMLLSCTELHRVQQLIHEMNAVLTTIIPGLSVDIHDFGEQLMETQTGHKIELLSNREGTTIPLKYESEGIIKLISILNILMCVYNDPSMCLVLDELDTGIYEYLLGELLSLFEKGAMGQLIFTSHNLRVLELLKPNHLIFSTTNPNNRYIRVGSIPKSSNLRDVYLRSILLGGQKEMLYTETDSVRMSRAFRRFGKAVNHEN